jgi:O-methyltransferase
VNLLEIVQPYTCLPPPRIQLLIDLATKAKDLEGDMAECGVYNGGSGAILAHFAAQAGKTTWLFDSFQGLPPTTANDVPSVTGAKAEVALDDCKGSEERVKEVLKLIGANLDTVWFVVGWFKDTFPAVKIPKIALLSLDSDWYESEKLCLEKFYDSVVPGGFIYFDDFYYWPGCANAVIDFFNTREEYPVINRVHHAAWIQKGVNGPKQTINVMEWRLEELKEEQRQQMALKR